MKIMLWLGAAFLLSGAPRGCQQNSAAPCYKGKLAIKGICANYTIQVVEGNAGGQVQASWTDEQSGKSYANIFRLANPCSFPENLKEGDVFYFSVDTGKQEQCNVCMAYYPTPEKAIAIKVLNGPCK